MAKQTRINPYLLCLLGVFLVSAGFLMGPFPVLIFAGLAPAFALVDYAEGEFFWNKLELVLIITFAGYFSAHGLNTKALIPSLVQSIAVTIAFAGFSFTRQSLGTRLGRLPLLLFLLTLEYIILKTGIGGKAVFLADALKFKIEWIRWTEVTGYLGVSLWILFANHLLYLGALRHGMSVPWLVVFLAVVLVPVGYSYILTAGGADRDMMLGHYGNLPGKHTGTYEQNGEWIPRTAAWVSALIVIFAFVKSYIKRK